MLKLPIKCENSLDNQYKKWHKRRNEREGNKVKIGFYCWSFFFTRNSSWRDTDSWGIVNFKLSLIFSFVLFLIKLLKMNSESLLDLSGLQVYHFEKKTPTALKGCSYTCMKNIGKWQSANMEQPLLLIKIPQFKCTSENKLSLFPMRIPKHISQSYRTVMPVFIFLKKTKMLIYLNTNFKKMIFNLLIGKKQEKPLRNKFKKNADLKLMNKKILQLVVYKK